MKVLLTLFVFSVLIFGLGAQSYGWGGPGYGRGGWGPGGPGDYGSFPAEESVSGTVSVSNGTATLGDYTLYIPAQVVLKDGDTVEAMGFVNGSVLSVTQITVNGDEYYLGGRGFGYGCDFGNGFGGGGRQGYGGRGSYGRGRGGYGRGGWGW